MINYKEFTDKYYPSANDTRLKDIERFLRNLENLTDDIPLEQALTDKQLLCRAFYLQKTGNISRAHYQKIKDYLIKLFVFIGIDGYIPSRDEVINSCDKYNYFGSLEKLLQFIDKVGYANLGIYNPTQDLIRVKAICILGWLGFTLDEIVNLKNTDLIVLDNIGFKISNSHESFEIYNEPFAVLYYLQNLTSYNGLPTGKRIYLKGDDTYLFRPFAIDTSKMNAEDLIQLLKRFNQVIPETFNKSIIFRNLHKNALFLKIYNSNIDNQNLRAKIMDVFDGDIKCAYNYEKQYLQFAQAMDNKNI